MPGSAKPSQHCPRIYWDANVFLAFFNKEAGAADVAATILAEAANGEVEIFTSALSIVEANHLASERSERSLAPGALDLLTVFWANSPVQIVEMGAEIARKAFEIARASVGAGIDQPIAKSPDAIHLATALWVGVEEFHSLDKRLRAIASNYKLLAKAPEARSLVFPPKNSGQA
jgi:predicted nucleic acid-binding protein